MAIATLTGSCPGVEQSSIQGGKSPSSSRSIKSGAMHLAPAPDIKELSNFLLLERSGIQVCVYRGNRSGKFPRFEVAIGAFFSLLVSLPQVVVKIRHIHSRIRASLRPV